MLAEQCPDLDHACAVRLMIARQVHGIPRFERLPDEGESLVKLMQVTCDRAEVSIAPRVVPWGSHQDADP